MSSMAIAGASPVGELVEWFVIYDDGTTGRMQVSKGTEPTLSRSGSFVSEEEYGARVQQLGEGTAAHVAELQAADEARQAADYEALVGLGVPEDSARRMAGYDGGQR